MFEFALLKQSAYVHTRKFFTLTIISSFINAANYTDINLCVILACWGSFQLEHLELKINELRRDQPFPTKIAHPCFDLKGLSTRKYAIDLFDYLLRQTTCEPAIDRDASLRRAPVNSTLWAQLFILIECGPSSTFSSTCLFWVVYVTVKTWSLLN
jgi:hypothetical protein